MRRQFVGAGGSTAGGAYYAGFLTGLNREYHKQHDAPYFQGYNVTSGSVWSAMHVALGLYDFTERCFREEIHGSKFVNWERLMVNLFLYLFTGRFDEQQHILKFEHLVELSKEQNTSFELEKSLENGVELFINMTDYETGKPFIVNPNSENLYECAIGASTFPFSHKYVVIDGRRYVDGELSGGILPLIDRALEENYDETVIAYHKPKSVGAGAKFNWLMEKLAKKIESEHIRESILNYDKYVIEINRRLNELEEHPKIKIIRPEEPLPMKVLWDVRKSAINKTFNIGYQTGVDFLNYL